MAFPVSRRDLKRTCLISLSGRAFARKETKHLTCSVVEMADYFRIFSAGAATGAWFKRSNWLEQWYSDRSLGVLTRAFDLFKSVELCKVFFLASPPQVVSIVRRLAI